MIRVQLRVVVSRGLWLKPAKDVGDDGTRQPAAPTAKPLLMLARRRESSAQCRPRELNLTLPMLEQISGLTIASSLQDTRSVLSKSAHSLTCPVRHTFLLRV
jgi:hypothetical protein